jgi:mRNA-degrading endonuclease RelE of RelBE toxin-antitoxin system
MNPFTLLMSKEIEAQLRRCRGTIRNSIRRRLQEITSELSEHPTKVELPAPPPGPPLRFYVSDGYRVFYSINPITRNVVVLKLQPETS